MHVISEGKPWADIQVYTSPVSSLYLFAESVYSL